MDTNPIVTASQALSGLLLTAESEGLPLPFDASVNKYAPTGHTARYEAPHFGLIGGIILLVHTAEDVAAWRAYLGDGERVPESYRGDRLIHLAFGMAGPIPVCATAHVTRVGAV